MIFADPPAVKGCSTKIISKTYWDQTLGGQPGK